MKTISKFFLIFSLIFIAVLAFPTSVSIAPLNDGRTILGESYTLKSGGTLEATCVIWRDSRKSNKMQRSMEVS